MRKWDGIKLCITHSLELLCNQCPPLLPLRQTTHNHSNELHNNKLSMINAETKVGEEWRQTMKEEISSTIQCSDEQQEQKQQL